MKYSLHYKRTLFLIIFFTLNSLSVFPQEAKVISSESKLTVDGTSNLHDWTIEAKEMSGKSYSILDSGILKEIKNLDFSIDVIQLESGRSGMDANTVKALNGKAYKTITFKLIKVEKITKTSENTFTVETQGNLTIKGTTKLINQNFTIKIIGNKLIFSGKQKIDMTFYGVEPPKALMGTIKTGKDVIVDFKITYN